ncbi:hypothetical protein HYV79_03695 [Candidatus Woesearchaeota archaeon]|nr:hypothetical protein [Candidatus Woesearchaeota archaeon]
MGKTYLKKDINNVLLFLVMLTCTALVGLTVVFANQFDGVNTDYAETKVQLEAASQELAFKSEKLGNMEQVLQQHIEREKALEELLIKG